MAIYSYNSRFYNLVDWFKAHLYLGLREYIYPLVSGGYNLAGIMASSILK